MADVGFVDRVEVLGDVYEVQTELVDAVEGRLRTVVFHDGRVVAVNTARLHGAGPGGGTAEWRDLVRMHHELVLGAFAKRTRRLEEHAADTGPSPCQVVPSTAEPRLEMPPIPEDPALADALEIRRLYGELRRRVRRAAVEAAGSGAAWLERAEEALDWLRSQPRFGRIRLDEQARINVLAGRLRAWRDAGRPPGPADDLRLDVELFCAYVWDINNRRDLLEFDWRLIAWALATLDAGGGARAILKPLAWLRGRDVYLDDLLDTPESVAAQTWREHLERLQHALAGE